MLPPRPPSRPVCSQVYNSIRVFITAYVWMTGFGNFSFFYLKVIYARVRALCAFRLCDFHSAPSVCQSRSRREKD